MEIEIATVGGYEEVGRQMTAVRMDDEIVVFDMGLNLSQVLIHDNVQTETMHSLDLIDMGAIPDDRVMSELDGEVTAIVPTHGHLDHIGAIPKLAHRYDAPIVATPFTIELVRDQIADALESVAADIRTGTVHLDAAADAEVPADSPGDPRDVDVPQTSRFETELERLTDSETGEQRYELEWEVRWND
jgi:ribonuclease J